MTQSPIDLYHTTLIPLENNQPPEINLKESTRSQFVQGFTMTQDKKHVRTFVDGVRQNRDLGFVYHTTLADLSDFQRVEAPLAPETFAFLKQRLKVEDPILFGKIDAEMPDNGPVQPMSNMLCRMDHLGKMRVYNILYDCGIKGLLFRDGESVLFFNRDDVPPLTAYPAHSGLLTRQRLLHQRDPLGRASTVIQHLLKKDSKDDFAYTAPYKGKTTVSWAESEALAAQRTSATLPASWEEFKDLYEFGSDAEESTNIVSFYRHKETRQQLVVKTILSPDAAREEHLAGQLYQAFGVDAAQTALINGKNGKPLLLMEYIQGRTLHDYYKAICWDFRKLEPAQDRDNIVDLYRLRRLAEKDFPIDMLLCNYDALTLHDGNMIIRPGNTGVCRIDFGAALRFHCDGALKTADDVPFMAPRFDHRIYRWGPNSQSHFMFRRNAAVSHRQHFIDLLTNGEYVARLQRAKQDMPKVRALAPTEVSTVIEASLDTMLRHFEGLEKTRRAPATRPSIPAPLSPSQGR